MPIAKTLVEAWENEVFKKELIASPIEAIQKLTGEKLNVKENFKIVVVDQSDSSTLYFNIPSKPIIDDIELSEEQMELVSGGWRNPIQWGIEEISIPIARWFMK